ncbi:MAG TPA: hypothetical protein VF228_21415 [Iamia sp.]
MQGLRDAVRAATGRDGVATWTAEPLDHHVDNMTTERLDRVTGTLDDGTTWSLVAKTLRPASASPQWAMIPPFAHEQVLRELDWRDEPRVYRSALATDLPQGVRLPRLWHVDEGDERIVLWLEDVDDRATWDVALHLRAAEALGRLAGTWPDHRVTGELDLRRRLLGEYFGGPIVHVVIPALAADATWSDPLVAAATADDPELRTDLVRLGEWAPELVERVHATAHALGHGDAAPANILDDGTDLVLVDWSYGSTMAMGMDLAQLVAGTVAGRTAGDVTALAEVDAGVVDAFCRGVAAVGGRAERADVELAYRVTLAVRSALPCLDVGHAADLPDEQRVALLAQRAALARVALDRLDAIRPLRS